MGHGLSRVAVLVLACGSAMAQERGFARFASSHDSHLPAALQHAFDRAGFSMPLADRERFVEWLTYSPMCFDPKMTPEQWNKLMDEFQMLPPGQTPFGARFNVDTTIWAGDGLQGLGGRATRAALTYSFPADGTTWGLVDTELGSISGTGPNNLGAGITSTFGASDLDEGREYIRQTLGSWRRYGGITYTEVADAGIPHDQVTTRRSTVGDIRIGGRALGANGVLAYNAFPTDAFAGVGGGDMCINTSYFNGSSFGLTTENYRFLRNTAAHEHGHGLGMIHQVPCVSTKLMEPSISINFDMLEIDDRRGAGRAYGDRFSGNNSAANAIGFGDLTNKARIERPLSTNGTAGANNSDEDWFRFSTTATQNLTVSVEPLGGTYTTGQQSSGCTGTSASRNASAAGNLNIELRNSDGSAVIATSAVAAAGAIETLTLNNLPAGAYTVRVVDVGPNNANDLLVQLYALTVRMGANLAPPYANAGVNKRVAANTNCFFMGDVNSAPTESGSSISAYAWDLDADGSFETAGGKVNRQYVSNGVYPITLRVTANNGQTATDTIQLTVFGATTTVTGAIPNNGTQGQSVPVVITGTNFKNVTNSSMVTVSGTGVTVSGTPVPNPLGTQISGLTFNITGSAAPGPRTVTVTNTDGTGNGVGVFTVNAGNPCPVDLNGDGLADFNDYLEFLNLYNANDPAADFNGDNIVDFNDYLEFLNLYNAGC